MVAPLTKLVYPMISVRNCISSDNKNALLTIALAIEQ